MRTTLLCMALATLALSGCATLSSDSAQTQAHQDCFVPRANQTHTWVNDHTLAIQTRAGEYHVVLEGSCKTDRQPYVTFSQAPDQGFKYGFWHHEGVPVVEQRGPALSRICSSTHAYALLSDNRSPVQSCLIERVSRTQPVYMKIGE